MLKLRDALVTVPTRSARGTLLGRKYLSTTKIYVSIGIGTLLGKYATRTH